MVSPNVRSAAEPAPTPVSQRGRLEFLDGVRGIGASLVVIQHLFETWFPAFASWSQAWIHPGRVGVVAFFVVSGYVVGLTLSKQEVSTFAVRRFWRLYPVYWVATGIWIAVDVSTGNAFSTYGTFVIILNILMIQGAVGVTSILGTGWTLGMEIFFYGQAALAKKLGRFAAPATLGFVWLGAFAILAIYNVLTKSHYGYLMPVMLVYAALGYSLFQRDVGAKSRWQWLLGAATVGIGAISLPFLWSPSPRNPFSVTSFNLSSLAGLAIFGFFYVCRERRVWRSVLWLGSVSYALYLIHVPILILFHRLGVSAPIGIPLVTFLSLVAAWLLREWVEKPTIRIGRSFVPRARLRDG